MNNKNKVLLTSIGLAIFSGIAATSTTFAWFTTTQNASLSFNSATVETQDNNLSVVFKESLNDVIDDDTTDANTIILNGLNKVTDISGNGVNFYKPHWNAALDAPGARVAYEIVQVGETADGYYVDFTLTISRGAVGTGGMKVYLGAGTEITAHTDLDEEDEQAVLGSRLAVLDSVGDVILVYAPDEDPAGYNYITPATGQQLYSVNNFNSVALTGVVNSFATYTTVTAADVGTVAIADLSIATTADVTFRAWLEGEDADTNNNAIGGVFDIDLKIYGLTV